MNRRILVVDDEQGIRAALGQLLEYEGYEVRSVSNAADGIAEYQKWKPNLVFMDVKMADLDGFSTTRRLAADETTAHIPVIAVTASALGNTRQTAKDAGCAAYIQKPVRAEAVFAALQNLGVEFVSGAENPELVPVRLGDPVRGSEAIAEELSRGGAAEAALGQRLVRLAANVDFDGVRELVASLAKEGENRDVG